MELNNMLINDSARTAADKYTMAHGYRPDLAGNVLPAWVYEYQETCVVQHCGKEPEASRDSLLEADHEDRNAVRAAWMTEFYAAIEALRNEPDERTERRREYHDMLDRDFQRLGLVER